jgi:nucleoside-diphosphate-sugar epimerase
MTPTHSGAGPRLADGRPPYERWLRVGADAALVALSLVAAVSLRLLGLGPAGRGDPGAVWPSVAVLVPLAIALFWAHGFYTRGRFYQTRYKAVAIVQVVTLLYLAFAALAFYRVLPALPRGDYVVGWLLTLAAISGARFWMFLWRRAMGEGAPALPALGGAPAPHAAPRRVLVIGGGGYIGSALLPRLLEEGYTVRLLDALVYGEEPIRAVLGHPRLEIQRGDFRHVDAVVQACRDVDAVVHLGGIVGDPACAIDEQLTIDVNLSATRMIGEVARGMGVRRLVFASSCSVYGANDHLLDEKSALYPVSLYARTKLASERVLQELQDARMAVVVLRFSTIFGFSGRIRFDLVVNLLTAQAARDKRITVRGGDQWRPFVHVNDAAESVVAALAAPREAVAGEVFNVGSNANNHTIRDVGQLVQRLVPDAELLDLPADGDRRNYRVAFAKIHQALGFVPEWTVEQGIRQVLEYLDRGIITDWQDARYSNYKSMVTGQVQLEKREPQWEAAYLEEAAQEPPLVAPVAAPPAPPTEPDDRKVTPLRPRRRA